jgi:hypothetical protein
MHDRRPPPTSGYDAQDEAAGCRRWCVRDVDPLAGDADAAHARTCMPRHRPKQHSTRRGLQSYLYSSPQPLEMPCAHTTRPFGTIQQATTHRCGSHRPYLVAAGAVRVHQRRAFVVQVPRCVLDAERLQHTLTHNDVASRSRTHTQHQCSSASNEATAQATKQQRVTCFEPRDRFVRPFESFHSHCTPQHV